jgi:hypothetical protein
MATSQKQQTALSFFQSKGWTAAQAAGIVGNLQAESGLNPQAFNGAGGGKGAAGVAQWRGVRQTVFETKYGIPLSKATLEQQLDYVNYELTEGAEKDAGKRLKATTNAADAATIVDKYYERSEGTDRQKRIGYANALSGGAISTPSTSAPTDKPPEDVKTPPVSPETLNLKPYPNVLHGYASYTYGLSLHLLTQEEYNKIVEKQEYTPKRVLIASAGRYNNTPGPTQFIRSPYFKEDFYFDNFTLDTVIGLNESSRSSNAIRSQFTIIEPYGITLINRLIDACNDPEINCSNYIDMPYLLQIDFFGINDAGEIVGAIPNTTKRLPIRLNKISVRASVKGAEYSVDATPYNHSAYDLSTVSTPANFEVHAKTVAQFFQTDESSGGTTDTSAQRENAQSTLWKSTSGQIVGLDGNYAGVSTLNQSLLSQQTKKELGLIQSFGSAINMWCFDQYKDKKIGANDKYVFKFDDEIGNSLFTDETLSPKDTGMVDPNKFASIKKSNLGSSTDDYDSNMRIFQINAGTTIDKVIGYIIRNSKWVQSQIVIPDGETPEGYLAKKKEIQDKPFYWFKIVPSIKLLEFDKIRKIWAREITYHVQKYEVRNVKIDVGPQGKAEHPVKAYNYIYTGKNDDVLDFDLQFNALYYNAMTVYRNALTQVYNVPTGASEDYKDQNPSTYAGTSQDPNSVMPSVLKTQVIDTRTRATGGEVTAKQVAVADLESSLLTMSGADMLHVKLKIIGDPHFIKQDDVFYPPKLNQQVSENKSGDDPRLVANGSLTMDTGEVYAQLLFRTPVDIDETTGLMRFEEKYKISSFSGLYKILTVNTQLRNGQFIQDLDMVRLPNQSKFDYTVNQAPTSDNRLISSVPGQSAITNDYLLGPDFTPQAGNNTSIEEDNATQSAQDQLANNNIGPNFQGGFFGDQIEESGGGFDPGLQEVNATADTQPISGQTEPQAVIPNFKPISIRGNQVPGEAAVTG